MNARNSGSNRKSPRCRRIDPCHGECWAMSLARILAIVGACLAALLSGCSGKSDGIVLGFSQAGTPGAWRTANSESIKSAAGSSGVQLHFSDAGTAQEEQVAAIRS